MRGFHTKVDIRGRHEGGGPKKEVEHL
jgi:hypothetical protein